MRYLKTILTIISILLLLNIVKEYIPISVQADSIMRVDIVKVNGFSFKGRCLPVFDWQ
jgi:hypothetical protein